MVETTKGVIVLQCGKCSSSLVYGQRLCSSCGSVIALPEQLDSSQSAYRIYNLLLKTKGWNRETHTVEDNPASSFTTRLSNRTLKVHRRSDAELNAEWNNIRPIASFQFRWINDANFRLESARRGKSLFTSAPGSHPEWVPVDANSIPPDVIVPTRFARRDYSRFKGNKDLFIAWRKAHPEEDITPMEPQGPRGDDQPEL